MVAAPRVQEVFSFLRLLPFAFGESYQGLPIIRAFARNTLASAGLREKESSTVNHMVLGRRGRDRSHRMSAFLETKRPQFFVTRRQHSDQVK